MKVFDPKAIKIVVLCLPLAFMQCSGDRKSADCGTGDPVDLVNPIGWGHGGAPHRMGFRD